MQKFNFPSIFILAFIFSMAIQCGCTTKIRSEKSSLFADRQIETVQLVDLNTDPWLEYETPSKEKAKMLIDMISNATPTNQSNGQFRKQIRLKFQDGGEILQFDDKNGLVKLLTINKTSVYRLENVVGFNRLLKD